MDVVLHKCNVYKMMIPLYRSSLVAFSVSCSLMWVCVWQWTVVNFRRVNLNVASKVHYHVKLLKATKKHCCLLLAWPQRFNAFWAVPIGKKNILWFLSSPEMQLFVSHWLVSVMCDSMIWCQVLSICWLTLNECIGIFLLCMTAGTR